MNAALYAVSHGCAPQPVVITLLEDMMRRWKRQVENRDRFGGDPAANHNRFERPELLGAKLLLSKTQRLDFLSQPPVCIAVESINRIADRRC